MFFAFIAATVISTMRVQLGALVVLVVVFKAIFAVVLSAAMIFGLLLAWRSRYRQ